MAIFYSSNIYSAYGVELIAKEKIEAGILLGNSFVKRKFVAIVNLTFYAIIRQIFFMIIKYLSISKINNLILKFLASVQHYQITQINFQILNLSFLTMNTI